MSRTVISATFVSFGLLLITVGCGDAPKMDAEQVAAYRTKFTLADEPDGIQTVADVRLTLLGESAVPHDHDGDGKPDHSPEEHDALADADKDDAHHSDHDDSDGEHAHHDEDGDRHGDEVAGHDDGDDHEGHDEHAHHDKDGDDHSDETAGHDEDADHDHKGDEHGHEHAHQAHEVVMLGNIGGLANPWAESHRDYPFKKTEAIFFLADPEAFIENEEAGHKHAPGEECAFCAAHAADKADLLAIVRFVDEKGEVLQTDARELFDVKEHDMVVVSGEARITDGGILVVDARGLYVRR